MKIIEGNRYDYANDTELLDKQYHSGEYKENRAIFAQNLFIVLGKLTYNKSIAKMIEDLVSKRRLNTVTYLFCKDLIKIIETDIHVNLGKYEHLIKLEDGFMREPIEIKVVRNRETEFSILISKLGELGMINLFKILSEFRK